MLRDETPAAAAVEDSAPASLPDDSSNDNVAQKDGEVAPAPGAPTPQETSSSETPQFTDADLVEALIPIFQSALEQTLSKPGAGLRSYLEAMLRSTVRRAVAEQMESSRQFDRIGTMDKLRWRLRALFNNRGYQDIVFEKTRRFQVEEAYLFGKKSRSLISYASNDPVAHASPRRVAPTARKILSLLRAPDGSVEGSFNWPDRRLGLVREGEHSLLVGIIRGRSNALVRADLDYVLKQIEERFGERLENETDIFLHVLQPILEGCLLIQSPPPPS